MRSTGFRFLVVALLALLMFIPQFFASAIVQDRSFYADQTRRTIGEEWGGPQRLSGPYLTIPVEGDSTRIEQREVTDPETGELRTEQVRVPIRARTTPIILLPEDFVADIDTFTEIRSRGIFEVPVYSASIGMTASFDSARLDDLLRDGEELIWDEATLRLGLTGNRGLRGDTVVEGPDGPLDLEPFATGEETGVEGRTGRLTSPTSFSIDLSLNGAEEISVAPVGRMSEVTMRGDWMDPSFSGAFLPSTRDVTDSGYSASWTVPHLARALPQVQRAENLLTRETLFGTTFIQVNDFYQTAWRAGRHGILFIALTFLTVLLLDRKDRPTHPVQYIFIGVAQSLFVLLMVAYAEQIGFTPAYLLASIATVGLLTFFAWVGLKMGRRTLAIGGLLTALYGTLFVILQSEDLALLFGATLAFGALALTIVLTRNEEWYGAGGPGNGFRRKAQTSVPNVAQAKAASSAISTMSPKED
ncbi:cell envelope integrity protein CreD [Jannaschia pohangensis]|uniref:Inner membrane protein n=1 Tax=Jannaschia pohangensis TaxID=390807 RepID=A0A1I3QZ20_9RHOB|nr:cell envelope integrity protein CreD [Jannaschia pohangensis]SFJ38742.1 inner membrane protein [Jannaschia pohangensis]